MSKINQLERRNQDVDLAHLPTCPHAQLAPKWISLLVHQNHLPTCATCANPYTTHLDTLHTPLAPYLLKSSINTKHGASIQDILDLNNTLRITYLLHF